MRLRSGSPHWIVDQRTIDSTSIVFDLTRRPNLAELTEVGLRQGFQVTGVGGTKVVEGHGPTVTAAQDRQALHQLEVRPSNPAASLSLADSSCGSSITIPGPWMCSCAPASTRSASK